MDKKIKLIWDFRGPAASKTAEHHEKHLKEYIAIEGTAMNITGHQEVTDMHSYAFMVVGESEMIGVRDALKPHRGEFFQNPKQTRINKYLSEVGYCSRRAADKLIEQGRVTINGQVPEMGTKITDGDEVRVDGNHISESQKKPVYLAFNKPVGIVCTTDTGVEKDNIIDFINYPKRIFPIGRLDKPSEGLIFLTDDGDIVNKILRARNNHEKEYLVTVNRPITEDFLQKMSNGVPILNTVTRKCKVTQIGEYEFKMILTQGLNRQIRRMCEYLDYYVKRLKRIRIMNVKLDIPVGKWRDLTDAELKEIHRLTATSDKTRKNL